MTTLAQYRTRASCRRRHLSWTCWRALTRRLSTTLWSTISSSRMSSKASSTSSGRTECNSSTSTTKHSPSLRVTVGSSAPSTSWENAAKPVVSHWGCRGCPDQLSRIFEVIFCPPCFSELPDHSLCNLAQLLFRPFWWNSARFRTEISGISEKIRKLTFEFW